MSFEEKLPYGFGITNNPVAHAPQERLELLLFTTTPARYNHWNANEIRKEPTPNVRDNGKGINNIGRSPLERDKEFPEGRGRDPRILTKISHFSRGNFGEGQHVFAPAQDPDFQIEQFFVQVFDEMGGVSLGPAKFQVLEQEYGSQGFLQHSRMNLCAGHR
jgi:hypothetical protein